tara:strand:- start:259 stop:660 length:402 start_codon:yes stop_codon:yes gene_type:complete
MATGETNLNTLLKSMQPVLHEGIYVFHSSSISFSDAIKFDPVLIFKEKEGTALILKKESADQAGLEYQYPCRMITLNIHLSLEAVGFLAAITRKLADANISVNSVSAHFHDHLFIPEDRALDAMNILNTFAIE